MITLGNKPDSQNPNLHNLDRIEQWSPVTTIIALLVIAALGGAIYCVGYLHPQPRTISTREMSSPGDNLNKSRQSNSSAASLPMPMPLPMPLPVTTPIATPPAGNMHIEQSAPVATPKL
jgi:hypothetical protein